MTGMLAWNPEREGYQHYFSVPSHRGSCNQQRHCKKISSPIYEHTQGWAVSAQLILTVIKIDGSLDANGCVYGRHQGGRHLRAHSCRDQGISSLQIQEQASMRSTATVLLINSWYQ